MIPEMRTASLALAPPMQEHDMPTEPQSLAERMDRQEKALGDLRQDTATRFAEQRAHTNNAIQSIRDDVHGEFKSLHGKLDKLISAVDRKPEKRKLFGR